MSDGEERPEERDAGRMPAAAAPVAPVERLFGRVPILAGVALPPGPSRSLLLVLSLAAALPLALALTAGADLALADAQRRAGSDVGEGLAGPAPAA